MIELRNNCLHFQFPEIHKTAECRIDFQRTLRIPDDNSAYPLPPGLGSFPIQHVDDFADTLPDKWLKHGGVFVPMYQSEALWINFHGAFPCAVKIAAGKINAVNGSSWTTELSEGEQDYVAVPEQPWLDGFNVSDDFIRQFVAMPLGKGYTAEEQITGSEEHGGIQVIVYPMKKAMYEEILARRSRIPSMSSRLAFKNYAPVDLDMGLAPGGLMRQKIYDDPHGTDVWDQNKGLKCFVHLANSEAYKSITGSFPPHKPNTAQDYEDEGLPWFEYYSDSTAISGSDVLDDLQSVGEKFIKNEGQSLPDNKSFDTKTVKAIGHKPVRTGDF